MRQYIDENLFYDKADIDEQCEQCGFLFDQNEKILCDESMELVFCGNRCRQEFLARQAEESHKARAASIHERS